MQGKKRPTGRRQLYFALLEHTCLMPQATYARNSNLFANLQSLRKLTKSSQTFKLSNFQTCKLANLQQDLHSRRVFANLPAREPETARGSLCRATVNAGFA